MKTETALGSLRRFERAVIADPMKGAMANVAGSGPFKYAAGFDKICLVGGDDERPLEVAGFCFVDVGVEGVDDCKMVLASLGVLQSHLSPFITCDKIDGLKEKIRIKLDIHVIVQTFD